MDKISVDKQNLLDEKIIINPLIGYSYVMEWMDFSWKTTQADLVKEKVNWIFVDTWPHMKNLRKHIEEVSEWNPNLRYSYYKVLSNLEAKIAEEEQVKWKNVVLDRSSQSTLANHRAMWSTLAKKEKIEDIIDTPPDLTFYFDVSKEGREERMKGRKNITDADRKLMEEWGLLEKTGKEYNKFENKHNYIDTTNKTPDEVNRLVMNIIKENQQKEIKRNSIH